MTHATAAPAAVAAAAASQQLIPPLIHAVSGAIGGALALLLFYPLERARIEMQKSLAEETDSGFPIEIPRQSRRKEVVGRGGSLKSDSLGDSWSLGSSDSDGTEDFQDALSEIVNRVTLSACVRKLWDRNELYRGVAPLVITLAASNFVFFYVNELIKRLIFLPTTTAITNQRSSNSYRSLIASCLAGICNVLLTNPLWVANLRIVTGESKSSKLIPEMVDVARANGVGQLWSGTGASLWLVSNPVIQFFLYEELKVLQLRATDASLAPVQAFVTGAVAKAIATIVTYPLQVTQTVLRMQQSSETEAVAHHHHHYTGTWDCLVKVYGRDGAAGLFTGMRAKLLQTVLTAAFTFLTYEQIVTALYAAHQSLLARQRQRQFLQ